MSGAEWTRGAGDRVQLLPSDNAQSEPEGAWYRPASSTTPTNSSSSAKPVVGLCLQHVGCCRPVSGRVFAAVLLLGAAGCALLYWLADQSQATDGSAWWYDNIDRFKQYRQKLDVKPYERKSFHARRVNYNRLSLDPAAQFDIQGLDVLVFVHIQKTAGTTFERYLTRHLDLPYPCLCKKGVKRCECRRNGGSGQQWLFSRFSTGWSCGLHADWTELVESNCVDNVLDAKEKERNKRRYFYTTLLREPVARTLSELRHVQRGATWQTARHICNGRPPTPEEWPLCFDPSVGWSNVTLHEFVSCPFNPARNRQTRMLADLSLVGCYGQNGMSTAEREHIMLESAKHNLAEELALFGLTEHMRQTQLLFQHLFQLHFLKDFAAPEEVRSKSAHIAVSAADLDKIRQMNHLDMQLYDFAKQLFFQRLKHMEAKVNLTLTSETSTPSTNSSVEDKQTNLPVAGYRNRWKNIR